MNTPEEFRDGLAKLIYIIENRTEIFEENRLTDVNQELGRVISIEPKTCDFKSSTTEFVVKT
jgi:hypothetical protein